MVKSVKLRLKTVFPKVELRLDEVLVTAGEREEFVMSGGAASWQDLVLYLIGRFVSPRAAQAMAKFELLERHAEGQAAWNNTPSCCGLNVSFTQFGLPRLQMPRRSGFRRT